MDKIAIFLSLIIATSHFGKDLAFETSNIFDVVKFGAVGDGETNDSSAFEKAWEAACGSSGNPIILISPNKTFLLTPTSFHGPCKTYIHFMVLGNIVAPGDKNQWSECASDAWLSYKNVDSLIFVGNGTINGHGSIWWEKQQEHKNCRRPTGIHFGKCNNLKVSGVHFKDSPKNHISINRCSNVTISNIKITAPKSSPNTDGIDISSSIGVSIRDSHIGTGDDCVAINGGSKYIDIRNVGCGPGHGISVGSLGRDQTAFETVEEVRVENCHFNGTENGARIKTVPGGSGYARNIIFQGLTFENTENPIIINQYYNAHRKDKPTNESSNIAISDVSFCYIHGTSADHIAINLNCSESIGCTNITMNDINIVGTKHGSATAAFCKNVQGTVNTTIPEVPCLSSPYILNLDN